MSDRQIWARYHLADKFCAVKDIKAGAVFCYCNGSFPEKHVHELDDNPAEELRCGGCARALEAKA